jgi:hypothetical protein
MTASIIGGLIALAGIVVRPVSTWLTEAAATRRQRDALLTLERLVDVIVRASGRRVPRRGRRSS